MPSIFLLQPKDPRARIETEAIPFPLPPIHSDVPWLQKQLLPSVGSPRAFLHSWLRRRPPALVLLGLRRRKSSKLSPTHALESCTSSCPLPSPPLTRADPRSQPTSRRSSPFQTNCILLLPRANPLPRPSPTRPPPTPRRRNFNPRTTPFPPATLPAVPSSSSSSDNDDEPAFRAGESAAAPAGIRGIASAVFEPASATPSLPTATPSLPTATSSPPAAPAAAVRRSSPLERLGTSGGR